MHALQYMDQNRSKVKESKGGYTVKTWSIRELMQLCSTTHNIQDKMNSKQDVQKEMNYEK